MPTLKIVSTGQKNTFLLYDEHKNVFLGKLEEGMDVLCPCGKKTKIKRDTEGHLFVDLHEKNDEESPYCCSGSIIQDFRNGAFLIFSVSA